MGRCLARRWFASMRSWPGERSRTRTSATTSVTAREMYNPAKVAEAGFRGGVAEARDWVLESNLKPTPRPVPATMKAVHG